jgi:hypothetical protein
MEDDATGPKSHVREHQKLPGDEMVFGYVEILDRANTTKKLELKEMLYIQKLKSSLNKQLESEFFSQIIRNLKLDNSITSDAQRYHKKQTKKLRQIYQNNKNSKQRCIIYIHVKLFLF